MTVKFMPALGQVWLVITFSAAKINILRYHAIPLCEIINNPLAYFAIHYSLFAIRQSIFPIRYSLFANRYSLFANFFYLCTLIKPYKDAQQKKTNY